MERYSFPKIRIIWLTSAIYQCQGWIYTILTVELENNLLVIACIDNSFIISLIILGKYVHFLSYPSSQTVQLLSHTRVILENCLG